MATLKDELASLKIDHDARAGGKRRGGWLFAIAIVVLAGAAAGWFWSQGAQAATVKTTVVTAVSGGATPGAVLNASGYVTARRRHGVVKSDRQGPRGLRRGRQGRQEGQVLARLDDSQVRAARATAQAQLTAARGAAAEDEARLRRSRTPVQRLTQLVQEKVVGRAEVDTAGSSR